MKQVKYAVRMKDVKNIEMVEDGIVAMAEVEYENELPFNKDGELHTTPEWQEHYRQVLMSIVGSEFDLVVQR